MFFRKRFFAGIKALYTANARLERKYARPSAAKRGQQRVFLTFAGSTQWYSFLFPGKKKRPAFRSGGQAVLC